MNLQPKINDLEPPSRHKISLIIPAYNEEKFIGTCLERVILHSNNIFHEIIVVDNNSSDKTCDEVRKFQNVKLFVENEKGVTRARQRGFKESEGDILVFLDADNIISKKWLDILVKEFGKDPDLACLSGPMLYKDVSDWKKPLIKTFWIFALPLYFAVGYMAVGGNMALRRNVLEKMNGFDTSIEFYGDDTDTARRAAVHGRVYFNPFFSVHTSSRRLNKQGLINTSATYVANFFSEAILHKPVTKKYKDFR